jgi:hypothetical protein
MPSKITIGEASDRYRVTTRTIHRWVRDHSITQYADGTYDATELDDAVNNTIPVIHGYMDVDWDRAACKNLPTEFFYKIEERNAFKVIDMDVFRFTCTPCPIWKQCLGYAFKNERYGVWGGMTADERRSLQEAKDSEIKTQVMSDFVRFGISETMINEAIGK